MKTIVYQGRPSATSQWMVLSSEFVPDFKRLDYEVRELVLRTEAEFAQQVAYNAGLEKAALAVVAKDKDMAKAIRALKTGGAA